jgi:hypothetical protein
MLCSRSEETAQHNRCEEEMKNEKKKKNDSRTKIS